MIKYEDYFYYDETSPSCLRWKVDMYYGKSYANKIVRVDDPVGSLNSRGYWNTRIKGINLTVHTIIAAMHGKIKTLDNVIDHANGDVSDNRNINLILTTQRKNSQNRKKSLCNNSGKVGVHWTEIKRGNKRWIYAVTTWCENDKNKTKVFSVRKYGIMVAFKLAVLFRNQKIQELNAEGQNYTLRHVS